MARERIGLVLVGVGDLSGGGGAERFFADFFVSYHASTAPRAFDLCLISDGASLAALRATGREIPSTHVLCLRGGRRTRLLTQPIQFWQMARRGRFALLHLTFALPRHLLWMGLLAGRAKRALVTIVRTSE